MVVPRRPSRSGAVDSQLLAAVALARGFESLGCDVVLLTEDGPQALDEVALASVRAGGSQGENRREVARRLPRWARLALADVRALQRRHRLRSVVVPGSLDLVVQFHHRFQDVGRRLATQAGCPLVLRVEAIEVEEQRDWGLRGPRSGKVVTALGELRLFRAADAVAAVSPPLATSLFRAGVPDRLIRSIPNGVDTEVFRPGVAPPVQELARRGLEDRFLIGWVGGFRPYHGLEQLADLLPVLERTIPEATVCLVGTGPLERDLERLQRDHPRSLAVLPPVAQDQVASWLCAFDVCLQLSRPDGAQHYSPLKVREYLACARPVVAPAGAPGHELVHGTTGMLYPAGDMVAAMTAISALHADPDLARRLGETGRRVVERDGSWAAVAARMWEAGKGVGADAAGPQ